MNSRLNKEIQFIDLGRIDFKEAWDYQTKLLTEIVQIKIDNRDKLVEDQEMTPNYLIFCEHPPIYTLGKSGSIENVLLSEDELKEQNIQFEKINRGGDITYHGPGQIVGYPVLDLENFFTDIHKYLRFLEECIIKTLAEYNVLAGRIEKATGVWLDVEKGEKSRKICAMGIRCSRWVTMHGWAFNVNTDLSYFKNIIPCGITDKGVASLNEELATENVEVEIVKQKLLYHFSDIFDADIKKNV